MGEEAKPDFSGWATKAGLKCSDGRIIMPDAFKHQDAEIVPLVWQHGHSEPSNVLGHAVLEHREDGVYAYGYFNDTDTAKNARTLVQHKDIKSLSIYANQLTEKSKQVIHGFIRELSLVLSGANPGALIDNITLAHTDGELVTLDDEAIIYTGLELHHADDPEDSDSTDDPADPADPIDPEDLAAVVHASDSTVQDVYDSFTEEQKSVVHYLIGVALEGSGVMSQSSISNENKDTKDTDVVDETNDTNDTNDINVDSALTHTDDNNNEEGRHMTRNVFEQQSEGGKKDEEHTLSHDALKGIVEEAKRGGSLKEAVEKYAFAHGIEDIDLLFPDAKSVTDSPEFDSRRIEWVAGVLNGTRHSPFTRIKSLVANITFDEARAKGYIKGNLKKEEWFGISKRVTTPSTVYKKQKLDRDDILDITDFDVVMWLKAEMRLMLDEELAGAILIGDGRAIDDEDKIKDPMGAPEGAGIRSILFDHDFYVATQTVDDSATSVEVVDGIVESMKFYKGSGSPTFYTTLPVLTQLLLTRDQFMHRMWKTKAELASEIGVADIVTVEVMEREEDLIGIVVNLKDYTIGTDRGGETTFFDDFDIDYNQYKYLYETRLSGALTKIRSGLVIKRAPAGAAPVVPAAPTMDGDGVVTINATTHVVYHNQDGDGVVSGTVALSEGESITIYAVADTGYYFENNIDDQWTFTFPV